MPQITATAHARALAERHPLAMLPCPVCAASVKGENIAGHLAKTHAGFAEATSWRGSDGASFPVLLALPILWVMAVGALALSGATFGDVAGIILGATAVLSLALVALSSFRMLPARLELDGDRLRLVFAFGLLRRELRPSGPIEVGGLRERRPSAITSSYQDTDNLSHEEVRAGTYLRVIDGTRSITLATRAGTSFRKHWAPSGWRAGPARRRADITLDRTAMAALEHHLAALGLLAPRSG